MFNPKELMWTDIQTKLLKWPEYLGTISEKLKYDIHLKNWENYHPKPEIIQDIQIFLKKTQQHIHILSMGASWCPDCSRNLPRMAKIENQLGENVCELFILGGLKVKLHHKPDEIIWAVPPSPKESIDPRFNVSKIPMIYVFHPEGACIGRIVENPTIKPTLEEEIWHILQHPE